MSDSPRDLATAYERAYRQRDTNLREANRDLHRLVSALILASPNQEIAVPDAVAALVMGQSSLLKGKYVQEFRDDTRGLTIYKVVDR